MELCADIVVVFADLAVRWVRFGFCSSAKSCNRRAHTVHTWYFLVIRDLGNFWLIGISSVLGRRWWTAVSRDEVEDRSELVDNAIALRKKSSFFQRDPSACRAPSAEGRTLKVTSLCQPWYFP